MAKTFVGLDVADKTTAICVVSAKGEALLETSTETSVVAIANILKPYKRGLEKIACESGSKSMWLARELIRKNWPVVCLDAMHTHAALKASINKTDANDARGIAEVVCRGIYTPSYIRSEQSQAWRAILAHRKSMLRKRLDLQGLSKGVLKQVGCSLVSDGNGLAIVTAKRRRLDSSIRETVQSSLAVITILQAEHERLDRLVKRLAEADPVCRRLMTIPGVGAVTAFAFRASIEDPLRFSSSRLVPAYFGLTPRTYQSGETSRTGRISKRGDSDVRSLLYQCAGSLINICKTDWRLKRWAKDLAKRKGFKLAAVACARRLAVVMHRMWVTGRDFDPAQSA